MQTFDLADMQQDDLFRWWIDNAKPTHLFLADPQHQLLRQLNAGEQWPEVMVVDCYGEVKYHSQQEMNQSIYAEVKKAIDDTLQNTMCPL